LPFGRTEATPGTQRAAAGMSMSRAQTLSLGAATIAVCVNFTR
jgi:hypothetical protein